MDAKTKVKVIVDTAEKPYFYLGYIKAEEDGFLLFDDDRNGPIRINKAKIISIQEVGGQ